jgi:predicted NBD/HSP70 family sugar kinase
MVGGANLTGRLKEAFHLAGIIGEEINTLVAYSAAVSRKLERHLAMLVAAEGIESGVVIDGGGILGACHL